MTPLFASSLQPVLAPHQPAHVLLIQSLSLSRFVHAQPLSHPLFHFHTCPAPAQVARQTRPDGGRRQRLCCGPFGIHLSLCSQDRGLCRDIAVLEAFNILYTTRHRERERGSEEEIQRWRTIVKADRRVREKWCMILGTSSKGSRQRDREMVDFFLASNTLKQTVFSCRYLSHLPVQLLRIVDFVGVRK